MNASNQAGSVVAVHQRHNARWYVVRNCPRVSPVFGPHRKETSASIQAAELVEAQCRRSAAEQVEGGIITISVAMVVRGGAGNRMLSRTPPVQRMLKAPTTQV